MDDFGKTASLASIFVQIWIDLGHGVIKAAHPFHTPVLASLGDDGPDARTVVLRQAVPRLRQLLCHTDIRSPKVADLRRNQQVAWLFYDRGTNTQLRIKGRAGILHDDELARARWKQSPPRGRACYQQSRAPGTPIASPAAHEPLGSGCENFAVIDCRVESIDWLYLQHAGHLRARFTWNGEGWDNTWLAP